MDAPSNTFEDKHEHQVTEMKRLVYLYVKGLRDMSNPSNSGNATPSAPTSKTPTLVIAPGGFPMVPASFNPAGYSKRQLEKLIRQYLSHHYRRFSVIVAQDIGH